MSYVRYLEWAFGVAFLAFLVYAGATTRVSIAVAVSFGVATLGLLALASRDEARARLG